MADGKTCSPHLDPLPVRRGEEGYNIVQWLLDVPSRDFFADPSAAIGFICVNLCASVAPFLVGIEIESKKKIKIETQRQSVVSFLVTPLV